MKQPPVPFVPLEWPRRLLVGAFALVSVWYLAWRFGTLNPAAPWFSALVYGAELFGFGTALLHIFMCWRMTERRAPPARPGITVDVFVPTYNESVELVRKTLLAARAMDYPHRTWLLDDGRRPEMKALARHLGCEYLARADDAHAKAGNLNHALANSSGELVVVFDADHAPRRDFLTKTLGYFDDAAVAFVQTPQDFYNLDSYQHRRKGGGGRTLWTEQSLFFRVIQRGKDYWNSAFFCGSCAIVRRRVLDEIGGFATGTVTEDLHTSLRIHARGHQSVYHAEPLAFGLAPESIEPFIGQRVRWGQGAMHVWRKEGILTHKGLTLAQRFNYLASALTYFDGWQKAVFYFAPAVVLLSGVLPLLANTQDFLLHFLPYYVLTFWVFEEVGRGYGRSLFIEQYNMARFAAFAWATLAWIFPRMTFRVTAKGALAGGALRFTAPQWAVLLLNGLAVPVGTLVYVSSQSLPLDGLIANSVWALTNAAMAIAVITFTAVTQRYARTRYRFPIPLPAEVVIADGTRLRGTVDDLSEGGMRFYGKLPATLDVGAALTGHLLLPEGPVPFWGEVRSRIAMPGDAGLPKAIGCRFTTSDEGRERIESFLFGSDLQWLLNGYTDRVHTPLSRWLRGSIDGPLANPVSGLRWNAAEVRVDAGGPVEPVLTSAVGADAHEHFVVSHNALPERRDLMLDVYRRTDAPTRSVRLQPVALTGPAGHAVSGVYLYRVEPGEMLIAPDRWDEPAQAQRDEREPTRPAALTV
ncbi:MAG TPA: glycosyltransferase [Burkholderiaceae bacterium]|nr:glycosyltransferase [Burkholderiaceae bacterium]